MADKNFKHIPYHVYMSAKLDKMISNAKRIFGLKTLPNTSNENNQKKVTFRVDAFTATNLEKFISQNDSSISIFVKTALYNYISFYKELSCEPFEIGHWLDNQELDLSFARYTITLDDTLSNEFNRLESVYKENRLTFNKSHLIRCAVIDRLYNLMIEDV